MFSITSLLDDSFSWQTALSLASASKLSYEASPVIEDVTSGWGFSSCTFLDISDTQCFIAETDDIVLIAFRGTEDLADWLGNLSVLPSPWPPQGTAHAGFLNCFGFVRDSIVERLSGQAASQKKLWLTGHSLGGALATIAAAELQHLMPLAGVHTYGQPRLCDGAAQAFFETHLGARFFRFVNNDDLVTRVPPHFRHVGTLIHFDEQGEVRRADTEAEAVAVEEPALSDAEFESMKAQIRAARAAAAVAAPIDAEGVANVSIEGLFPSIADHRLDRYIAILRRFVGDTVIAIERGTTRNFRSVEPMEASDGEAALEAVIAASESALVPILLRVKSANWHAPTEVKVNSRLGTVISAQVPMRLIPHLQADAEVVAIEVSRDAGVTELAHSVPFVGGDAIHAPPVAEKGDSALIGIIDTGIDVLHRAFQDANSKSRVLAVWNQKDNSGKTPNKVDPRFTQDYGRLYLASEIEDFIAGRVPTPDALRDDKRHGTHVASIAAGRGVDALGDGMAPEARLVVVIPHTRTGPGEPPSLGYSVSHVDALDFLKRVSQGGTAAMNEALPIAVNVSLGMNAGAHDGSSTLEAAFDAVTNGGRDPGYVIVKSAGNERGHDGHVREQVFAGVVPITWQARDNDRDHPFRSSRMQDYIEAWYESLDELEFTLVDPGGRAAAVASRANPKVEAVLGGNLCNLDLTELHPDNGANRLVITIIRRESDIQVGEWTLKVHGTLIRSRNAFIDLWVERDEHRAVSFENSGNDFTLSIPGTARTVITVGACHSQPPLELVESSSFGLTRDERPKPDLCAPGNRIIAAKAGTLAEAVANTGTSMAAPHVAGALALVLSKRHKQTGQPQYNARQLQAELIRTVKNFSHLHHKGFGYGMLDAEKLFDSL